MYTNSFTQINSNLTTKINENVNNIADLNDNLTWNKSVVVDGLFNGETSCENVNNYRYIYLEMVFWGNGRVVGELIPIPRFKETKVAHMIQCIYDNADRWVVARYVDDTTIAIDYSVGHLNNMHVWLVNY